METVIVHQPEYKVIFQELNPHDATIVEQTYSATYVPEEEIKIVIVGTQGPPGLPGLPGASADGETVFAAAALSGQRIVVLNSVGKAIYASADTPAHIGRVIGLTKNAVSADEQVSIKTQGIIEHNGWNWVIGQPIYLGINGNLTQTPPLPGVGFLQILGTAITATSMMVRLQTPIRR